jgi:protein-S-isoprenylcysteine O-methyltransferase
MIHPWWLAMFYALSEIVISTVLRSRKESKGTDKGSLRTIWLVINVSMISAILIAVYFPAAHVSGGAPLYWTGFVIFALGIALRWYSITYLGKFFTVDVIVTAEQTVIDTGPYRLIRHPSYAGSLTAFLGLALCMANFVSLALIMIPITSVFLYRIRIEESALLIGLGDSYKNYMRRTKRLVPFIY